jgi:hypothetical protein
MRAFEIMLAFIAFYLFGCVASAALSQGDGDGDGKMFSLGNETIEVLTLPEGFDMSHPALNLGELLKMRKADALAILPELPEDIPTVMVDVETKVFCETSDASPLQAHILYNANTLFKIANVFCCQYRPLPFTCSKMTGWITAGTDICGIKGSCIKCGVAAQDNQLIASYCINGLKAGGYVRYFKPFCSNDLFEKQN